jgi:hypothetical protein
MAKSSKALIAELQRTKRFMGTCPVCTDDFHLSDATLPRRVTSQARIL